MDSTHLQALDAAHHVHPFTNYARRSSTPMRMIASAEGCWLVDAEGHRYLDGMAGLWCVNVGYGRQELVDAATEQLAALPYYNSFFQCTTPPSVELTAKLAKITPPDINHFFFANSGSEANDSIVKFVRYYWNIREQPHRKIIIGRRRGYHGVTLAAASLSGISAMHPQFDLPLPGFVHIDCPEMFEHPELSAEEVGDRAAQSLRDAIEHHGAGNIAAFIGEPVQGAGGVVIPPENYWPQIQSICNEHGILLIADEVICGFGRTGHWFGSDRFGISPDIMTMAKGLSSGYQPISAVGLSDDVWDVLSSSDEEFSHGFTYSGHPVACAVAIANLDLIERDKLHLRGSGLEGHKFADALNALTDHPLVGAVRYCGLMAAIELVRDKASLERFSSDVGAGALCRDACLEAGLVMRAVGDTMILSPPLTISGEEIDMLHARAHMALEMTARQVR